MKKKEVIKQQNKMRIKGNLKAWKYARIMCLVVPLAYILYSVMSVGIKTTNYEQILIENPAIIAGFAVCMANLFMWYILGVLFQYLNQSKHLETVRFYILLMSVSQLALLNYISLGFLVFGLYKYFHWNQFSIRGMFLEMKKDNEIGKALLSIVIILFFIFIELLFLNLKLT